METIREEPRTKEYVFRSGETYSRNVENSQVIREERREGWADNQLKSDFRQVEHKEAKIYQPTRVEAEQPKVTELPRVEKNT